jgi:hypothetical protein
MRRKILIRCSSAGEFIALRFNRAIANPAGK